MDYHRRRRRRPFVSYISHCRFVSREKKEKFRKTDLTEISSFGEIRKLGWKGGGEEGRFMTCRRCTILSCGSKDKVETETNPSFVATDHDGFNRFVA